jgi:hypothetical protein
MSQRWFDRDGWDDTQATETDGTHTCRVCGHGATIQTPQRRTEHYCTECEAWQRFESVHTDTA